jgi:hypothetical protein
MGQGFLDSEFRLGRSDKSPAVRHPGVHRSRARTTVKPALYRRFRRVSEGTRTPDRLDHNQELYQLSYAHQARPHNPSLRASGERAGSAG